MRRSFALLALPLFVTACQGAGSSPPLSNAALNGIPGPANATFSKPNVANLEGPPKKTWIFAANGISANIEVYNAATLNMISTCPCTGMGLAVDPTTNDLAVGSRAGVVTVWHVSGKGITQSATLQLSQGPYAIGLAYDSKGDLYAGNVGQNVVDFFTASEIRAGGGNPTRSVSTSSLVDIYYLAAPGDKLLADGYNRYGQPILVSVNVKTGGDTVLQNLFTYNTLAEGIAVDTHGHLIVNSAGSSNVLLVFDKPWTGSPVSTFPYGSGGNSYYTAISLNKRQDTIWAGNYFLLSYRRADTNVQAISYPLGRLGRFTSPVAMEYFDSVAVDPQAK
jgi:WD40 repeat protein